MKTKKYAGIIAALAAVSTMSINAGAQNIINDVLNGAENVIDDTVDTAENVISGGNDNTIGDSGDNTGDPNDIEDDDDSLIDSTDENDIPDQVEDDADDDKDEHPSTGKDENTVLPETDEEDPNPATGVSLVTAGLVALSAAGIAYLSKKRNAELND